MLIRKFKNFHDNEFGDTIDKKSDPFLAKNPFMLQGEEWKEKRAEITPAFTSSRMKALYPLIEDVQARMVEYVKLHIKAEEPFDVRELCAKYATDVVSNAIFGVDAQSFTKENPERFVKWDGACWANERFSSLKCFWCLRCQFSSRSST